jgi:hypothetical protein
MMPLTGAGFKSMKNNGMRKSFEDGEFPYSITGFMKVRKKQARRYHIAADLFQEGMRAVNEWRFRYPLWRYLSTRKMAVERPRKCGDPV